MMLGAELGQMPAWYVELSYALALEQCALLQQQPETPALLALQQGALLFVCSVAATVKLSSVEPQHEGGSRPEDSMVASC